MEKGHQIYQFLKIHEDDTSFFSDKESRDVNATFWSIVKVL